MRECVCGSQGPRRTVCSTAAARSSSATAGDRHAWCRCAFAIVQARCRSVIACSGSCGTTLVAPAWWHSAWRRGGAAPLCSPCCLHRLSSAVQLCTHQMLRPALPACCPTPRPVTSSLTRARVGAAAAPAHTHCTFAARTPRSHPRSTPAPPAARSQPAADCLCERLCVAAAAHVWREAGLVLMQVRVQHRRLQPAGRAGGQTRKGKGKRQRRAERMRERTRV